MRFSTPFVITAILISYNTPMHGMAENGAIVKLQTRAIELFNAVVPSKKAFGYGLMSSPLIDNKPEAFIIHLGAAIYSENPGSYATGVLTGKIILAVSRYVTGIE